jgi:hypothetical protein
VAAISLVSNARSRECDWVSNEVAHYNAKTGQFSEGLTFGDVHEALDLIFEILTGTTSSSMGEPSRVR